MSGRNGTQKFEPFRTKADVAKALGVSKRTVDRLIWDGFPCHQVGNQKRFLLSEICEWTKQKALEKYGR